MEISLDDINNDDMVCGFQTLETETKTADPFCFNGRNVMTKPANPQTDEKVVWVSRKAYSGRASNGRWEGEVKLEWEFGGKDPEKMHVEVSGDYKNNKGNGVGARGWVDRDGDGRTKTGVSIHPSGKNNKNNEK